MFAPLPLLNGNVTYLGGQWLAYSPVQDLLNPIHVSLANYYHIYYHEYAVICKKQIECFFECRYH